MQCIETDKLYIYTCMYIYIYIYVMYDSNRCILFSENIYIRLVEFKK